MKRKIVTISILAGGPSKRMGHNKALMVLHGIPLIKRIVDRLSEVTDEINVISNEPELYQFLGLPVFPDLIQGKGVLGGILTAISSAKTPFIAPIGCDLPFISPRLLSEEQKILKQTNVDVVIPESKDGLEPLHAVYRCSSCLSLVKKSVDRGDFRIISWFDDAKVKVLNMVEVRTIDTNPNIFFNINYPEDLINAENFFEKSHTNNFFSIKK